MVPDAVSLRLDWGDQLEARITATRTAGEVSRAPGAVVPDSVDGERLPPALAAMMEDRRADEREAVAAAERRSIVALPEGTWREIRDRAASIDVEVELLADGGEVRIVAGVSAAQPADG